MATYIDAQKEQIHSLHELWKKAVAVCEAESRVSNLILTGRFPVSELDSSWVNLSKVKARQWQSSPAPDNLEFSHGDYVNRFDEKRTKNGIEFLIRELNQKPDSNRACWSLLSMQDLVETENDKSIPSFMILQAGFSPDTRTIEVTTYFRAMEVHNFLPINMAEACLTVKQLLLSLSQEIGHFSLTIHAFNAYSDPDFSCLEKISMDYLENMKVMIELAFPDRGLPWMAAQLQEKRDLKESRINPNGISNMIQGMEFYNADLKGKSNMQKYDKDLIKKMKSIYADIEKYNQKRTNRSYSAEAMEIYANIKSTLDEVIKSIKK